MRYTWCMGGLSFFMFLILTISGVFLMFYYRPTPEYAYADIIDLREGIPLGAFMRNIHRWGAHAMVIAVWLHMFRVFMTGSYKPPREFNWNVGVILLVIAGERQEQRQHEQDDADVPVELPRRLVRAG